MLPQHADTAGEIVLGPFEVAVDAARVSDFAAAAGAGVGVPATFPIVWLSDPAMKDALRQALGPGRLPVHESQSFDYSAPLEPGARYRLEAKARLEAAPDRLIVESRVSDADGGPVVAMRSVLRLVDLAARAA